MTHGPAKAIPDGMHALTPYLLCDGAADAIKFYERAFGEIEIAKVVNANGKVLNGQVRIGDSLLMLMDEFVEFGALSPKSLKGSPVTIHLQVADVDAVVKQAIASGASVKVPIKDEFWGDRIGVIEDPFGHSWSVATHVRDVSPAERVNPAKDAMKA